MGKKKPKYYKIQTQYRKDGKWTTPKLREWGIPTPNKFTSKWKAKKMYWKLAMAYGARKKNAPFDVKITPVY